MDPQLQAFLLNSAIPALVGFALAHFNILLPARKPVTPVPVVPAPQPALPTTIRAIGQGGLIDIASIFIANIMASQANNADKIAAGTKIFEASQLVAAPK